MCFGISPLKEGLGHDHDAFPWNVVFFDEFAENSLRVSLGVRIGCIESLNLSSPT